MEPIDWLLVTGPAITLLLALLALLPGDTWPVDLATRDLDGEHPKLGASFALALGSTFALVVSAVQMLLVAAPAADDSTFCAIATSSGAVLLVLSVLLLTRLGSLTAHQLDQSIWFGLAPIWYVTGLAISVTLLAFAVGFIGCGIA